MGQIELRIADSEIGSASPDKCGGT
jgi:hypothetical protein